MCKPTALCSLVIILIISGRALSKEFFRSGSKNYYITPSKTNWYAARDECIAHGADLATFESIEELESVSSYLIQHGFNSESNDMFWVSYWDLGRPVGQFRSIATGQLLSISGWTPGQPNAYAGDEHCVVIWKRQDKYGMNDTYCNDKNRALCQQRSCFYSYGNQTGACK